MRLILLCRPVLGLVRWLWERQNRLLAEKWLREPWFWD